jgi:hypothetical protein
MAGYAPPNMLSNMGAPIILPGAGPEAQQQAQAFMMYQQINQQQQKEQELKQREESLRAKESEQQNYRGRYNGRAPPAGQSWHETRTCYNCGDLGHIAPDCTKPRKARMGGGATQGTEMDEIKKQNAEMASKLEMVLTQMGAEAAVKSPARSPIVPKQNGVIDLTGLRAEFDSKLSEHTAAILAEIKAHINMVMQPIDSTEGLNQLEEKVDNINHSLSGAMARTNKLMTKLAGKVDWQTEHLTETNNVSATNVRTSMDLMKQHIEATLRKHYIEVKKVVADVADIRNLMARREQMNILLKEQVGTAMRAVEEVRRAVPLPVHDPAADTRAAAVEAETELDEPVTPAAATTTRRPSWGSMAEEEEEEEAEEGEVEEDEPLAQRKQRRRPAAKKSPVARKSARK